ncbi:uncharacterized protein LOC142563861 isoform X1 [Dermacentor variabilis]|uniref:uncharacterized protein LOC142563861 isoform X1 n=1 Tax=Dermacentor variabilis TaxID=34621 RepID=UPI003F5BC7FD
MSVPANVPAMSKKTEERTEGVLLGCAVWQLGEQHKDEIFLFPSGRKLCTLVLLIAVATAYAGYYGGYGHGYGHGGYSHAITHHYDNQRAHYGYGGYGHGYGGYGGYGGHGYGHGFYG